jgi:hypothetical protein
MCSELRPTPGWILATIAAVCLVPAAVRAEDGKAPPPDRLEPALLPVLSGNTDIGFQFGAYGALARFLPGYYPYRWKLEAIASISVKAGPNGAEFPVHDDGISLDLPRLAGGRVRLLTEVGFTRNVDARYFGIGNATTSEVKPGQDRRRYQYVRSEPVARLVSRIPLGGPLLLLSGVRARYEIVEPYAGSKLTDDAASRSSDRPLLYGTTNHAGVLAFLGLLLDTRDHEFTPSRGMYHELSFRASAGEGMSFLGATLNSRFFVPLAPPRLVLASHVVADALFGSPPFYELSRGGSLVVMDLPGGKSGIRGVPIGRYHGPFKIVAGAELRSILFSFDIFDQRFRIGAAGFIDTGRVWSTPGLDGVGLGLKYGVGGGPRIHWGETVIIRADFAYSPDAALSPQDTPLGVYVEIGQSY